MLQGVRDQLFREPRLGISDAAGVTLGCLMLLGGGFFVVAGLFFSDFSRYGGLPYNLPWVGLGLFFALQGAAELLPRDRAALAGWLRVGALLMVLLVFVTLFVRLWTDTT